MAGHSQQIHQIRLQLSRRVVEHAANKTTDVAAGVMFNHVSAYTDPARYEAEVAKLFRGMPVVACLSTDLPQPGSFRLFEDVGVPIVVVRGVDNEVRAFLNVCRHRGARVVREAQGTKKRFTCRFHGWTYDTRGRAGAVAQEEHFCGAIADFKSLIPCPAAERYGLVFVQATPNSTMDIDAHLGSFGAELALLDLDTHERVCQQDLQATCNWKYAFDTYFENYHFSFLHRNSIGPLFVNDVMLYDAWGPHHRVVYPPRDIREWKQKPESEWLIDTLGTSYFIFPNTVIYCGALTPDRLYVNLMRMFPRGVGDLVTRVETYGPAELAQTPEYRAEAEQSLDGIIRLVQDEDYDVTGESWKNFLSMPAGSTVVYGRQELALQHSHQWFARAAGYAVPEVIQRPASDARSVDAA
jgi:phenylpropionate dioxygenase-like ring-hydroxylating dioxygenase large terminal subunit